MLLVAHVDESGVRISGAERVYALGAVITDSADHSEIDAALRSLLLPGRDWLHHYEETEQRRLAIAKVIMALPVVGVLIVSQQTPNAQQEAARAGLLCRLLPRLEHVENVRSVVIERRRGGDKHDRKVRDRLRRSRQISGGLRVDHADKDAAAELWLADFLLGSLVSATHHDQPEAWEMLCESHVIDVVDFGHA
ncbi:hypothetical protein D5S17_12870 [Pseudonocardiaceae bacterium YIM PH 21723]|nr:hypothetical protein D5S17_12870 [Pseudonocardiaceae bacterium YIM PH 21723]